MSLDKFPVDVAGFCVRGSTAGEQGLCFSSANSVWTAITRQVSFAPGGGRGEGGIITPSPSIVDRTMQYQWENRHG